MDLKHALGIANSPKMLQSTSAVNVANEVAIDVANDVLPVKWMKVYPARFTQSKSMLNTELK